jgi:hypothetical protein
MIFSHTAPIEYLWTKPLRHLGDVILLIFLQRPSSSVSVPDGQASQRRLKMVKWSMTCQWKCGRCPPVDTLTLSKNLLISSTLE